MNDQQWEALKAHCSKKIRSTEDPYGFDLTAKELLDDFGIEEPFHDNINQRLRFAELPFVIYFTDWDAESGRPRTCCITGLDNPPRGTCRAMDACEGKRS